MQRAYVGLRTKNGTYKVPKFSQCLVEYFSKNSNSVTVDFSLENGIFILNESEEGYELMHSPECPIKMLSNPNVDVNNYLNDSLKSSNIGVAACVVIESSDSHVLLTKRSSKMRSSPNVWVIPGGHLELNETIFQAGFREIKEETGLDISQEKSSVLGLWENIYPLLLGVGVPKTHVLVTFLHAQLNETHEQLTKKLVPDTEEVDSYCWLNSSNLNMLFNSNENCVIEGVQYVCEDGKTVKKNFDYSKMFNKWLWQQQQPYSGVNYALRKWMQKVTPASKF